MAAALPVRPTPRQSLDGVMIDIRSRRPRRVHVHQLARDRPRSPRSRSRLEMKDDWAAAALPVRPTPRQSLDGVMIDISSRRPHRVHVRHLAPDRPRSPRSRSRLEMKDDWAAAALPSRPTPRQSLDGVMIDISSRRPHRVHVRHLARDRPRSPEIAISPRDEGE